MAITRPQQETQGHIVEDYYLCFADDLIDLEKFLPDYLSHPQSHHIKKCIEKFAAPTSSAALAYDPREHSFQTAKLRSDTELNHVFFLIAAEYIKSLKLKKIDWEQLKEKITEAFNPFIVRKNDQRVVVHTRPFAPLDFITLLNYVIPHVVVIQGKRYLDEFSETIKEQTTLECQLVQFVEDLRETVKDLEMEERSACLMGIEESHDEEYQSHLFRDLSQAIWDQTFAQKRQFQFPTQESFTKFITSFFETGGELYKQYTKPLAKRYMDMPYSKAVKEFFPALIYRIANNDEMPSPQIERGICLTTAYPEAPLVNFAKPGEEIKLPRAIHAPAQSVGLNAFIKEDYIQVPEEDAIKVAARNARTNRLSAAKPASNSQVMARNAQKMANTLMGFFATPNKPPIKSMPKTTSEILPAHKLMS